MREGGCRVGGSLTAREYRTFMVRWRVEELKVQSNNKAGSELVKDGAYE